MSNGALVLGIAVLAIGGYVYYVRTQKHKALVEFTKANSETIDGELKLEDVVAYFKLQNLNQTQQTPFMAKPEGLKGLIDYIEKPGYQTLFVGVYGEASNELKPTRLFYAKSFDSKIVETFGSESLVILS